VHSSLFQKALAQTDGTLESWRIWHYYAQYQTIIAPLGPRGFQQIKKVMQMGICKLLTVSNYAHSNAAIEDRNVALTTLCTQYTDYCQAVGGKSAVKASCDWIVQRTGLPLDIYRRMIELHNNDEEPDVPYVRSLYEVACHKFGQHDTELWLEYITFESVHDNLDRVQKIHRRATSQLKNAWEFQIKYQQWKEAI
jgi:hypothetical protein